MRRMTKKEFLTIFKCTKVYINIYIHNIHIRFCVLSIKLFFFFFLSLYFYRYLYLFMFILANKAVRRHLSEESFSARKDTRGLSSLFSFFASRRRRVLALFNHPRSSGLRGEKKEEEENERLTLVRHI